jgi:hypothetical protein
MVGSCYVHNATSYKMLLKNGLTYQTVTAVWALSFKYLNNVSHGIGNIYNNMKL